MRGFPLYCRNRKRRGKDDKVAKKFIAASRLGVVDCPRASLASALLWGRETARRGDWPNDGLVQDEAGMVKNLLKFGVGLRPTFLAFVSYSLSQERGWGMWD